MKTLLLCFVLAAAAPANNDDDAIYPKLAVFARVLHTIEQNSVYPFDPQKLIEGAIRGMVATLDEHSQYFGESAYREQLALSDGLQGDVGVGLEAVGPLLRVAEVKAKSPAAEAGLLAGDVVSQINDKPLVDLSPSWAQYLLRGPVGSRVSLTVRRAEFVAPRRFSMTRVYTAAPPIDSTAFGDVLYVRLPSFTDGSAAGVIEALARARKKERPAGMVLDLRDNPGGLVAEAVKLVDFFVDGGVIVSTEGRGGKALETFRAAAKAKPERIKLAVLVNHGSASASEIVAGALQDRKRAVLVGVTTYGKASVQSFVELEDGSAIKLTTARYLTPSRRAIQPGGLRPDLEVEQPAKGKRGDPAADPQLAAALRRLHS